MMLVAPNPQYPIIQSIIDRMLAKHISILQVPTVQEAVLYEMQHSVIRKEAENGTEKTSC